MINSASISVHSETHVIAIAVLDEASWKAGSVLYVASMETYRLLARFDACRHRCGEEGRGGDEEFGKLHCVCRLVS
jgi:hypothetical protein